jgi:predicted ATPase
LLALSYAERMQKIDVARNDGTVLLLGQVYQGICRFHLGEFVHSRALLEQCHALNEPAHRAASAAWVTEDSYVLLLAWLGVTLTYLGYLRQGRERIHEALSAARRLEHAYALAFVLIWACWVSWAVRSPHEVQRHAAEALALSNEHGFPFFLAWGLMFGGWSLTALGEPKNGLAQLIEGLTVHRAVGAVASRPSALTMFTETHAQLLQPVEALNCLTEAAQVIDATQERYHEAEVYRLRGELLNATGDQAKVEENYGRALTIAGQQSAKIMELRAATSLARLWRDQGKRSEARDLLAPVYNWFTEGFETPVLQEAKALLEELGI